MKRSRKIWVGIAIFSLLLGSLAWFFGPSVFQNGLFCWYEYEDLHLGPLLPPVDETKIMLLGGLKDDHASFIEGDIAYYKILGQTTIYGKNADEIAEIWRYLPRNLRLSDLCHSPLYALQFRSKNRLLLGTTICWHCNNYTLSPGGLTWPGGEFGFDASSRISQALLSTLEKYVPPPQPQKR